MVYRLTFCLLLALMCGMASAAAEKAEKTPFGVTQPAPISTQGFSSSIHHWRQIRDDSRFIQALPDQPQYSQEQVREIASNILLFQRANGGWPKDYDMTAILTPGQRAAVIATHDKNDSSYDNGNIHSSAS